MICSQCNKEFVRDSNSQKYCKECRKIKRNERQRKYRQSDLGKVTTKKRRQTDKYKEDRREYDKTEKGKATKKRNVDNYHETDKYKKTSKLYRQSDKGKESKKQINKKYRQSDKGKEKSRLYTKKYKKTDKYKKYSRKYEKEKRQSDPLYKIKDTVRGRLYKFLKVRNMKKTNKTFEMVGCTPQFLIKYLEKQFQPGMTWDNHTVDGWHIDHKIPLDSANTLEDVEKLSHYTNLQPLWAEENLKKSDKII
jgi:hypothetical protein